MHGLLTVVTSMSGSRRPRHGGHGASRRRSCSGGSRLSRRTSSRPATASTMSRWPHSTTTSREFGDGIKCKDNDTNREERYAGKDD